MPYWNIRHWPRMQHHDPARTPHPNPMSGHRNGGWSWKASRRGEDMVSREQQASRKRRGCSEKKTLTTFSRRSRLVRVLFCTRTCAKISAHFQSKPLSDSIRVCRNWFLTRPAANPRENHPPSNITRTVKILSQYTSKAWSFQRPKGSKRKGITQQKRIHPPSAERAFLDMEQETSWRVCKAHSSLFSAEAK